MRKEGYNWSYSWNYTGDWYLLRAKFMIGWNFFVRELGRGRGVQERSLEVTEVLRRGGRRWCRHYDSRSADCELPHVIWHFMRLS